MRSQDVDQAESKGAHPGHGQGTAERFSISDFATQAARAGTPGTTLLAGRRRPGDWARSNASALNDPAVDQEDLLQELAVLALEREAGLQAANAEGGMPLAWGRLRSLAGWQVLGRLRAAYSEAYPLGPVRVLDRLESGPNRAYVPVTQAMRQVRDRVQDYALGPYATPAHREAVFKVMEEGAQALAGDEAARKAFQRAVATALRGDEDARGFVRAVRREAVGGGGCDRQRKGQPPSRCAVPWEALDENRRVRSGILSEAESAALTSYLRGERLRSAAARDHKRRALDKLEHARRPSRWRDELQELHLHEGKTRRPASTLDQPADPVFDEVLRGMSGCGKDIDSVGSGIPHALRPPRPGLRGSEGQNRSGGTTKAA